VNLPSDDEVETEQEGQLAMDAAESEPEGLDFPCEEGYPEK
jgi:hypothetical protein